MAGSSSRWNLSSSTRRTVCLLMAFRETWMRSCQSCLKVYANKFVAKWTALCGMQLLGFSIIQSLFAAASKTRRVQKLDGGWKKGCCPPLSPVWALLGVKIEMGKKSQKMPIIRKIDFHSQTFIFGSHFLNRFCPFLHLRKNNNPLPSSRPLLG